MNSTVAVVPNWRPCRQILEVETGARYAAFLPLGGIALYRYITALYQSNCEFVRLVFLASPEAPEFDLDSPENTRIDIIRLMR
jgi:hypothetical protein